MALVGFIRYMDSVIHCNNYISVRYEKTKKKIRGQNLHNKEKREMLRRIQNGNDFKKILIFYWKNSLKTLTLEACWEYKKCIF